MAQANPIDVPQNFSTTLNVGGGIDNSQTTGITLTSVTGLPTDGGILAVDWANPIDTTVIEYVEYTSLSGNTLAGTVTRGQEGYTAKTHTNGASVVGVVSRAHIKRLRDKLTGNDAVAIQDPNTKSILSTSYVASAVNQITVTNSATATAPSVAATGTDTNIDLTLTGKGTGNVKLGTGLLKFPNADGSNGQVLKTSGAGVLSFTTITTAVISGSTTAGAGTTGSAVASDIANVTCNITTTASSNIAVSVSGSFYNDTAGTNNFFQVLRGAGVVGSEVQFDIPTGLTNNRRNMSFSFVDPTVAAGTYTYKVQYRTSSGNLIVSNVRITVISTV